MPPLAARRRRERRSRKTLLRTATTTTRCCKEHITTWIRFTISRTYRCAWPRSAVVSLGWLDLVFVLLGFCLSSPISLPHCVTVYTVELNVLPSTTSPKSSILGPSMRRVNVVTRDRGRVGRWRALQLSSSSHASCSACSFCIHPLTNLRRPLRTLKYT